MQNPSSSVSSGNISPAIVGSEKGAKEVYVVGGMVLILAVAIGAVWYYSGQGQSYVSKIPAEPLSNAQVTNVLKTNMTQPVEPIVHRQAVPAASTKPDSIHTDIYFEVGRKGLTDDAKAILATQADLAKSDPDLGVLVQGQRIDRVPKPSQEPMKKPFENGFLILLWPIISSANTPASWLDVTPVRPTGKPDTEQSQGAKSAEDQEKIPMAWLPKTGTDGPFQLLSGLLILTTAAILWRKRSMLA
ncbi:MAG: LPXTG cell wall anchor domain-containing protein [Nitrospira sp.]|nr:LPXTG cell wall anchor domain-containing protein [Nitrospira sp.]